MIWYPTRGVKNSWRCVELRIAISSFVQENGKLANDLNVRESRTWQSKYSERNLSLIPLSHTLGKVNAVYKLGKGQRKTINHLVMDDLKLYGNSELTNTFRIFSKDIAMKFGISKCVHVTMKARKLFSIGRKGTIVWRSNTRTRVRQKLQILRYFGS